MRLITRLGRLTAAAVLTACTTTSGHGTVAADHPSSAAASQPPSSAATNRTGRSAAAWRRVVAAALLTTADLPRGLTIGTSLGGKGGQTQCASLNAVLDSAASDLAFRRVTFDLSSDLPFLDEVIAASNDATSVFDQFARTAVSCAHFTSTTSTGETVSYTVSARSTVPVGERRTAIRVEGSVHDANGLITVTSDLIVFQRGPVLVEVSDSAFPAPSLAYAPLVARLADRKLRAAIG